MITINAISYFYWPSATVLCENDKMWKVWKTLFILEWEFPTFPTFLGKFLIGWVGNFPHFNRAYYFLKTKLKIIFKEVKNHPVKSTKNPARYPNIWHPFRPLFFLVEPFCSHRYNRWSIAPEWVARLNGIRIFNLDDLTPINNKFQKYQISIKSSDLINLKGQEMDINNLMKISSILLDGKKI